MNEPKKDGPLNCGCAGGARCRCINCPAPKCGTRTPLEILVPGRPQPWQRPRLSFRGGRFVTGVRMRAYEDLIRFHAMAAVGLRHVLAHRLIEGPVLLEVEARFPLPARGKTVETPFVGRPDLDNLVKLADALNGVVWKDDAQVVEIRARKLYHAEPALLLRVTEVAT